VSNLLSILFAISAEIKILADIAVVSDSNDWLDFTSITGKDVIKIKNMSQQIFDKISFQYLEFICKDFK
jgi:hypothetical protein